VVYNIEHKAATCILPAATVQQKKQGFRQVLLVVLAMFLPVFG